ncbi:MAG: quinol:cytochrome C oxidoreductase [Planctomycetota bacterium]
MAGHGKTIDISSENRTLHDLAPKLMGVGLVLGVVGLAAGFVLGTRAEHRDVFYHSYLVSACFFLSISLGGLFFTMVQHLTKAGWSVAVRRPAEILALNVLPLALLFIPILIPGHDPETHEPTGGMSLLYGAWLQPSGHHAEVIKAKSAWLSEGFFQARVVVYFAVWILLSQVMFRSSVRQDLTGDKGITTRLGVISAPGMIAFALTTSTAAFDLLMSLRPEWFSTIFGVYFFAGCALGGFATMILFLRFAQAAGRLRSVVTPEHYQDLGKLLFGFGIVFWAYIGFSQFMLIWYANMPEETGWYKIHAEDPGWSRASGLLLIGHFFLPFLFLVSRHVKRSAVGLTVGAVYMLAIHWFDLFWLVMPQVNPTGHDLYPQVPTAPSQLLLHLLCFVGVGGVFLAFTGFNLRKCSLVAERDPRLGESLAFENY